MNRETACSGRSVFPKSHRGHLLLTEQWWNSVCEYVCVLGGADSSDELRLYLQLGLVAPCKGPSTLRKCPLLENKLFFCKILSKALMAQTMTIKTQVSFLFSLNRSSDASQFKCRYTHSVGLWVFWQDKEKYIFKIRYCLTLILKCK